MSIESEIEAMYQRRYDRREIKKQPTPSTLYQHRNNITKLHEAITGNIPTLFGQMNWIDEKSARELLDIVKGLKGRKGDTLGIAAQRSYLSSILVAIRVIDLPPNLGKRFYTIRMKIKKCFGRENRTFGTFRPAPP